MSFVNNDSSIQLSLNQRALKGGIWVLSLRVIHQLFYVSRLIILAHFLQPQDFGLFGIAMLTMLILETFSQTGFEAALIQKKEGTESYLNSAWTVSVIRGLFLFSLIYFISPYAAGFFNEPGAKAIIQVLGLSILFDSFKNIGVIYFRKELEFHKQFIFQFSRTLTDFIVAVLFALLLKNVWALILGILSGKFAMLLVSYLVHPFRPKLNFDSDKIKELILFGKWILGSSILVFLLTQGDDIFVGKILGVAMLGFYQMAYRISNAPASEISHVISQVTFPTYSKLQNDLIGLKNSYFNVLESTSLISFPIAGLIFIFAKDFTLLFLGAKWLPMVPAIQILVLWGLIRSIAATTGAVFNSVGKPKIVAKIQFIQLIFLAILIYPLTLQLNIVGTSLAVLITGIVGGVLGIYQVSRVIQAEASDFFYSMFFPFLNTVFVVMLIFIMKKYLIVSLNIISFFVLALFSTISYFGLEILHSKSNSMILKLKKELLVLYFLRKGVVKLRNRYKRADLKYYVKSRQELEKILFIDKEKDNLKTFIDTIARGDIIYDVGANIGLYTLPAAYKLEGTGQIIAFEPIPLWARRLKKNLSLNLIHNVKVYVVGLSNESEDRIIRDKESEGTGMANVMPENKKYIFGDLYKQRNIRLERGDDFIAKNKIPYPNIIKIDVEGAELDVLKGLEGIITEKECFAIFCEVHPKILKNAVNEVFEFLESRSFKIQKITKRGSEYHIFAIKNKKQKRISEN